MAAVGAPVSRTVSSHEKHNLPSQPRKPPEEFSVYSRRLYEAPYSALSGAQIVDKRVPERVMPRNRERRQVGVTNRWRLPDCLYTDMLGKAQALKAINMPYNRALIRIMTAESSKLSTNLDPNSTYTFRHCHDRPQSTPHVSAASLDSTAYTLHPLSLKGRKDSTVSHSSLRSKSQDTISTPGPVDVYIPKSACLATPLDVFFYHARKGMSYVGPAEQHSTFGLYGPLFDHDLTLHSLGMDWKLHRSFVHRAEKLLEKLVEHETKELQDIATDCNSKSSSTDCGQTDRYQALKTVGRADGEKHAELVSRGQSLKKLRPVFVVQLDITDPAVTQRALAIALGNLYHEDLEVELGEVTGVLGAADVLGFRELVERCGQVMLQSINCTTVCRFHQAAVKYEQEYVIEACEGWLELNLITQLSVNIQLREIGVDLLHKTLNSPRLFVLEEYSVFRTLVYWLFLQLNPHLQLMPSHTTILSFFNCLPKVTAFLETEEGEMFVPLFKTVHLHGITDSNHILDMQTINILPPSWLVSLLSQHYRALQGGGDMIQTRDFQTAAVRQGIVIDDKCHYHSEVLSLHGFHFDLKAIKEDDCTNEYTFYMERLKPGDPVLSFRHCERHTFSMRPDREVRYCLTAQCWDRGRHLMHSTGILTQKFGLGQKTCRSQVLKVDGLVEPIYVTYAVLFPPS